ncbi:MAG: hypothetical protein DRG55_08105 [Deltaproteobacteria bacterium]|nr:MAG: hypothetical protein DRG55_08105 [Deltaproteobacteria bacterium]
MLELHGDEMERLIVALGGQPGKGGRTRCFLHGGDNPTSFSYRPDGRWYCFVEGRGGNAVDLVMAARGCGYREALEFLADLGIEEARLRINQGGMTDRKIKRTLKKIWRRQEDTRLIRRHAKHLMEVATRAIRLLMQTGSATDDHWDLYSQICSLGSRITKASRADGSVVRMLERMQAATRGLLMEHPLGRIAPNTVRQITTNREVLDAMLRIKEEARQSSGSPERAAADR